MNRREFMVAAGGVTGGAAAVTAGTPVAAQEDEEADDDPGDEETGNGDEENGNGNDNGDEENGNGGLPGAGQTETVEVGDNYFEPDDLTIEPGTTVVWEWVGDGHNIEPSDIPEESDWEGHMPLEDTGFEYEYTFEVEGDYHYVCTPHVGVGMVADITVTEDAAEEAAVADVDIDELGVPIQKHFVGVATFLAIFVSLVFTFYQLKYGESPHSSSPGRDK